MLRGVYTAASAMLAQETAQSVIANNLANVNTPGYKGDVGVFSAYRNAALTRIHDRAGGAAGGTEPILGDLGAGVAPADIQLDLTDGALKETGSPLHVAARGNQFFVVRTPQGDRLTRAGEFTLAADGTLTDTGGYPVVGRNGGPIRLDIRFPATIDPDGGIRSNGTVAGGLRVVQIAPGAQPVKEGGRLLRVDAAALGVVARPDLTPGFLEQSNVTVVEEMVGMIAAMRAYEAAQKAVQAEDEALGKALNEVART